MKITHDSPDANRLAMWFHLAIATGALLELSWHLYAAWEHAREMKRTVRNPYY